MLCRVEYRLVRLSTALLQRQPLVLLHFCVFVLFLLCRVSIPRKMQVEVDVGRDEQVEEERDGEYHHGIRGVVKVG